MYFHESIIIYNCLVYWKIIYSNYGKIFQLVIIYVYNENAINANK